jgi:outer membrane protein OmpA-like peptidoglycan-associated protein
MRARQSETHSPTRRDPYRRRTRFLRSALAVAMLLGLMGCQTVPDTSTVAPSHAGPAQALSSLGFVADGNSWILSLDAPLSFGTDSDQLTVAGREAVTRVAQGLLAAGLENVRVEGHTDNIGSRSYNLDLSRRRAAHVAELMIAAGFPAAGIDQRALADEYPVATNATAEGRARNRRVTITVAAPGTRL